MTDISRSFFRFCHAAGQRNISSDDQDNAMSIPSLKPFKSDFVPGLLLVLLITQSPPIIGFVNLGRMAVF
jgi:hypothetical protein